MTPPDFTSDREATCPQFLAFLKTLELKEMICRSCRNISAIASRRTRHDKTPLLLGPPRSGKGTLMKLLRRLVATPNLR